MTNDIAKTFAEAARISPASVFETPDDVAQDEKLTSKQKEKILEQWQADAEAQQTATDEGMPAGPADDELDDVNEAKSEIERGGKSQ